MSRPQLPPSYTLKRAQVHTETGYTSNKNAGETQNWTQRCAGEYQLSTTTWSNNDSRIHGNHFQDIKAGSNTHQVIISTRAVISAQRVVAAEGATQWLGQMADATLQQMNPCRDPESHRGEASRTDELQVRNEAMNYQLARFQTQGVENGQKE